MRITTAQAANERRSGHPLLVNFDSLADGLYALSPGRFVAERTAAEKQARTEGDRELAARLHQLAKPTTVGWLANQLVRIHPEEIGPLLELGAGLREATASLSREKLQELMRLQHQVISGLIKQARTIAKDAGQRISEDAVRGLEDTLRAALADESLGAQLLAGRLTGALEHDGFPGATPGLSRPSPPKTVAKKAQPDTRLADAEQAVTQAQADAEEADEAQRKAEQLLETTESAARELGERVQKLQADLDQAREAHSEAERAERDAQKAAERSTRAAEHTHRRLDDARATRDGLLS
jgi:methyl-accepting chemotaxis protein